jgi:hypothetical protein
MPLFPGGFFHDMDAVRIHNMGEAVGDDHHHAALLDDVGACGGPAEKHDGWFLKKPIDGDTLLTAIEYRTVFTQLVQAARPGLPQAQVR